MRDPVGPGWFMFQARHGPERQSETRHFKYIRYPASNADLDAEWKSLFSYAENPAGGWERLEKMAENLRQYLLEVNTRELEAVTQAVQALRDMPIVAEDGAG